ncbi:MAG: hypothetical protein ACP5VR_07470 [Acidimicrobiales bacterium]
MSSTFDPAAVEAQHVERDRTLRVMLLGAIVIVLAQAGLGMAVNLYVTVPAHHPGAHPASYFGGSYDSVTWAIAHGAIALALHASLGLALVVVVTGVAVHAVLARRRAIVVWSVVGGLLVIGAGFNGASFLDFNDNINSLLMALLAFGAVASYAIALFLAARTP